RFFCFSADRSNKHEHRSDGLLYLTFASINKLPRKTVFIFYPAVSFAERIGIKRHQDFSTGREFLPYLIDLFFRLTLNVERNRWIEFEQRPGTNRLERLSSKLKRDHITIT